MFTFRILQIVPVVFFTFFGCTEIGQSGSKDPSVEPPEIFSHQDFDRVLKEFVDDRGLVDYEAMKTRPEDLDTYYRLLSMYSPDSHPTLFPTRESRLAYWLNAYNASVMKAVLSYYPISSVLEVRRPLLFFFLPKKAGFFLFQRVSFGKRKMSFYYLENRIIRTRYGDPRVHFALNCASRGCPRLPKKAFAVEGLDEQLDRETRKFLSEERNFRIDQEKRTIYISSILKWYESDFLKWLRERYPQKEATLINYVMHYLPDETINEIKKSSASYRVEFIPYDWSLNDRKGVNGPVSLRLRKLPSNSKKLPFSSAKYTLETPSAAKPLGKYRIHFIVFPYPVEL